MATFVHITDARRLAAVRRGGLRAERAWNGERHVFCVPVTPDYQASFQWARELRARGNRQSVAVIFRIDDETPVLLGPFAGPFETLTAAQAVERFLRSADPRGLEVRLSRGIGAREIVRIAPVNRATGWRHYPGAKGTPPRWPPSGAVNASRLRRAVDAYYASPWDAPPITEDD